VAEVRRICEVAARVGCVGSMWFLVGGRAFGFVVVRSSVRMRVLLSQLMPQSHPNLPSRFDLILHLSSCSVFAAVVAIRGVAFVPHSSSIVPLPLLSCLCCPQKLLFGR
jgi:hypothetical protein